MSFLSTREHCVAIQLVGREKYGLELVADSNGKLKRNAIYVLLGRMEEKGLVEGWLELAPAGASGPPRRKYRLTGLGERALAACETGFAILQGAL